MKLETERLILREVKLSDVKEITKKVNTLDVSRYLGVPIQLRMQNGLLISV